MWAESHSAYNLCKQSHFQLRLSLHYKTRLQHRTFWQSRRKRWRKHLPLEFFKILSGSHKEFSSLLDNSFQIRANFTVDAVWMRGGGGGGGGFPIGCYWSPKMQFWRQQKLLWSKSFKKEDLENVSCLYMFKVSCSGRIHSSGRVTNGSRVPSGGGVPSGDRVTPADRHPNILLFLFFVHGLSPNRKHTQVCHLKI